MHELCRISSLKSLCVPKTGNNIMFLIKQMMEFEYQDEASMLEHLNTFQGILNQLSRMNIKFEDEIHGLGAWYIFGLVENIQNFLIELNPKWCIKYELSKK